MAYGESVKVIYFYQVTQEVYGCFSNFSRHSIELDRIEWLTSEHYFQAQKFAGTPYVGNVRRAKTPREAAAIGRDRTLPLRADWEQVKDDVMRKAVWQKFSTHADIRDILLGTGDSLLVENTSNDYYWGCGTEGTGINMLGLILMETRAKLRHRTQSFI